MQAAAIGAGSSLPLPTKVSGSLGERFVTLIKENPYLFLFNLAVLIAVITCASIDLPSKGIVVGTLGGSFVAVNGFAIYMRATPRPQINDKVWSPLFTVLGIKELNKLPFWLGPIHDVNRIAPLSMVIVGDKEFLAIRLKKNDETGLLLFHPEGDAFLCFTDRIRLLHDLNIRYPNPYGHDTFKYVFTTPSPAHARTYIFDWVGNRHSTPDKPDIFELLKSILAGPPQPDSWNSA